MKDPKTIKQARVRIGVIADAHGYLDARVTRIFAGTDLIIVAGDVLDSEILATLRDVAPVTAVAGPSDRDAVAGSLPRETTGEVGGISFAVGHSYNRLLKRLWKDSRSSGAETMPDLVVWAGTHTPSVTWIDGTLFLNPGTASSPDPEDDDPTVAVVEQQSGGLTALLFPLRRRAAKRPLVRTGLGFRWGFVPTIMQREVRRPRRRRGAR